MLGQIEMIIQVGLANTWTFSLTLRSVIVSIKFFHNSYIAWIASEFYRGTMKKKPC